MTEVVPSTLELKRTITIPLVENVEADIIVPLQTELQMFSHINNIPVGSVFSKDHFLAEETLSPGEVVHHYRTRNLVSDDIGRVCQVGLSMPADFDSPSKKLAGALINAYNGDGSPVEFLDKVANELRSGGHYRPGNKFELVNGGELEYMASQILQGKNPEGNCRHYTKLLSKICEIADINTRFGLLSSDADGKKPHLILEAAVKVDGGFPLYKWMRVDPTPIPGSGIRRILRKAEQDSCFHKDRSYFDGRYHEISLLPTMKEISDGGYVERPMKINVYPV
jgi:hypothetical protein